MINCFNQYNNIIQNIAILLFVTQSFEGGFSCLNRRYLNGFAPECLYEDKGHICVSIIIFPFEQLDVTEQFKSTY